MVCCRYFKGLTRMFWTFKLSFDEVVLVFLKLATVLATFSKIWLIFSQSSGQTENNGTTLLHIGIN
jgi:hypothetical protein